METMTVQRRHKHLLWLFLLLLPALACLRSANPGSPLLPSAAVTASLSPSAPGAATHIAPTLDPADSAGAAGTAAAAGSLPIDLQATPEPLIPLSFQTPLTGTITGLAWYSDTLLLLSGGSGSTPASTEVTLQTLTKAQILQSASNPRLTLAPRPVLLDTRSLQQALPGFDLFKSIAIVDQNFFVTLQAGDLSFLCNGQLSAKPLGLKLDPSRLARLSLKAGLPGRALMPAGASLILFQGAALNTPGASAQVFDRFLNEKGNPILLPPLAGSLLSVTPANDNGQFWALLQTLQEGGTIDLVEMQFTEDGIKLSGRPSLSLPPGDWLSLARLDAHTLIVAGNSFALLNIP